MPEAPSRRSFLRNCGSAAAALGASGAAAAPARPNIVYILADDLGYGDLNCYNPKSKVPTPWLNHLAAQGARFTDAHSPSAVCTPTRYGIMTGRYCWRSRLKSGVLQGYSPALLEPGRLTVPAMLKRQGYRTAGFGKWHLGLGNREKTDYSQPLRPGPLEAGFDYYFGIPASLDMEPYLFFENDRATAQPSGRVEGSGKDPRGAFWREGAIAPGFRHEDVLPSVTKKAGDYLRRDDARPFFLYLALTAPHTPWLPVAGMRGKSKAGEYGDFVAMVDFAVDSLMRLLDERNLSRDTLVIFTSDNGAYWLPEQIERYGHHANGPLRGQKADIWEGGHRVPFIARWPGRIRPASVSMETTCLTDLMATLAEITGFELPAGAGEDSWSMLPALRGLTAGGPIREATVHHSARGHFSIRRGPWKLNLGRGSGGFTPPAEYTPKPGEPEGELFHLANDPAETRNLYLEKQEVVQELRALLEKYQRQGHSRPM